MSDMPVSLLPDRDWSEGIEEWTERASPEVFRVALLLAALKPVDILIA